eukprot:Tamp_21153.p1 GENE.Tamp_21153~~Tamp_21153.p1  ORF type:complete len:107 (-),score=3.59 Tamp_21153:10-330(-)
MSSDAASSLPAESDTTTLSRSASASRNLSWQLTPAFTSAPVMPWILPVLNCHRPQFIWFPKATVTVAHSCSARSSWFRVSRRSPLPHMLEERVGGSAVLATRARAR